MTEEKIIELEMSAFCPNEYAFISIPVTDKLPDMQAVASVFNENCAGFVPVDMLDYPYCVRECTRRIFIRPSYVKSIVSSARNTALTETAASSGIVNTVSRKSADAVVSNKEKERANMKVLEIDYDKYIYPEGVSTPEEFADYLDAKYEGQIRCRIPKHMEPIVLTAADADR